MAEGPSKDSGTDANTSWGRAVLAFVCSVAIGCVLWGLEEKNHQAQLRLEVEVTAEQASKRLSDWVEDRMNLSDYLADKWEDDYQENVPRYRNDVEQFVQKFPGFQAINWIDSEDVIRVVVPLMGNEQVVDVDLSQNPLQEVRDAITRSRVERRPTRTPASINLMQGGKGFATYWPIFDAEGEHTGYINAVFRVDELVETCLSRVQVTNKFLVSIKERSGALVYPVEEDGSIQTHGAVASAPVKVIDQTWDLYMAPSSTFYQSRPFETHHLIIPVAVLVGFLLGGVARHQALRKRDLLRSQAQYQKLFDQAPIGYFSASSDGLVLRANQAAEKLTGIPKGTLKDRMLIELFPNSGRYQEKVQNLLEAVRAGAPIRMEEVLMYRKDSHPFWALVSVEAVHGEDGSFSHFRLAIRDISLRKETEEARSCLSAAIEQAEEGIVIANAVGTVQYVNPAFRAAEASQSELLLQHPLISVLRSAGVDGENIDGIERALTTGQRWQGTYTISGSCDRAAQVVATLSPLQDEEGTLTHFVLIQRDITHEEELQAQLRQAQKLESVGRLAGGIAHDFNNILQSLLGYVSLARKRLRDTEEVEHCLVEIERSGHRAAELVALILAFGKKADEAKEDVILVDVVREVVALIQGSLDENIRPILDIGEIQYAIVANSTQVHQILMNLISNAQHAMEGTGGTLTVRVGAVTLAHEDAAQIPGLRAGCYMRLSIEDTGVGMDADTLERIFEPYFTTREQKRGSGLGLAMVHGLVEQYGGTIRVESQPGSGTTFYVYFPVEEHKMLTIEPRSSGQSEPHGNEEERARVFPRVLFVDDEAQIIDSMTRILKHYGFQVAGYTRSIDAVNVFREDPMGFDLVVTDLSMPELNGIALAKALNEIREGIPVILCSGYGETFGSEIQQNDQVIKRYLKKPITATKLRHAIEEVFRDECS